MTQFLIHGARRCPPGIVLLAALLLTGCGTSEPATTLNPEERFVATIEQLEAEWADRDDSATPTSLP